MALEARGRLNASHVDSKDGGEERWVSRPSLTDIDGRVRGGCARCRAAPNTQKAGRVSRGSVLTRECGCYDIIKRGGAREKTSVDEADRAGSGMRRRCKSRRETS